MAAARRKPARARRKEKRLRDAVPMTVSPHVFLKRWPERWRDPQRLCLSKMSTGTTKKVIRFQAMPRTAKAIFPIIPERSERRWRMRPTVAATNAQRRIFQRWVKADLKPSARVGSPPFRRMAAQLIRAVLKK